MSASSALLIERREWDSKFFGVKIGELYGRGSRESVASLVSNAMVADYRCLYSLTDCDDRDMEFALTSAGFKLVDVRIELVRDVDSPLSTVEGFDVSLATGADVAQLVHASRGTFSKSRFYSDPHFDRRKCEELYNLWVERDCSIDDAMTVVAERGGKLAGFWSASKIAPGLSQTGLGFVSPDFRGGGVPVAMMSYMSRKIAERWGVPFLQAATQGSNVAAIRMHLNCGFKFDRTRLWRHAWL